MTWLAVDRPPEMGHATWEWNQEFGFHVPVCSGWRYDNKRGVHRCGNGPLADSEIAEGLCSEGPHLPTHERSI